MDNRLQPLFTPWKIGSCEIKNRIVLTSMGGTDLFGWMEKNEGWKDWMDGEGRRMDGEEQRLEMMEDWMKKNESCYSEI